MNILKHLHNNRGDQNVSKMIWIVVIFVVGALLLTLLTTSFGDKVTTYTRTLVNEWFDTENGQYEPVLLKSSQRAGISQGVVIDESTSDVTIIPAEGHDEEDVKAGNLIQGDKVQVGDYEYAYMNEWNGTWQNTSQEGWGVRVLDDTKSSYGQIATTLFNKNVTNMTGTFEGCSSLTTAPDLSKCTNLKSMISTFSRCTSLTTAPDLSKCTNLTAMMLTFRNCTSLTTAPDLSKCTNLKSMICAFSGCTSLTTAPDLSKCTNLTNIMRAFEDCSSLTTAPDLSKCTNLTDMPSTFSGCTSLTTAPDLSKCTNLKSMMRTFQNCSSLTGNLVINANPSNYTDCLKGASTNANVELKLSGTSTKLNKILATASGNPNISLKQ